MLRRGASRAREQQIVICAENQDYVPQLGTDQMSHQADNIFAGTQVVSLVEIRGTNNSLVHPRGAVGVVTRTPTGDQDQFLVRFPDGFEASLTREKLDVLKHFKDRLPGGSPDSGFDLES